MLAAATTAQAMARAAKNGTQVRFIRVTAT
jgi:hypothetical protein